MNFINSEKEIIILPKITSLYFYSLWFPFHKKMLTMIDNVEKKYNESFFLAINVDNFKNLCVRFNVKVVPTVIIYKDTIEQNRIIGVTMTSAFNSAYINIFNLEEKNNEKRRK